MECDEYYSGYEDAVIERANDLAAVLAQRDAARERCDGLNAVVTALVAALEDRLHGDCDCAACVPMVAAIALAKVVQQ